MAIINGTSGNDTLNGTSSSDTIYGYGGSDTIHGGDGDDYIYGGGDFPLPNVDWIWGDAGNDWIYLGRNNLNVARGGDGLDHIYGSAGSDNIYGDAGDDVLTTGGDGGGGDNLYGGIGNDTLTMDASGIGTTTLDGGVGDDVFNLSFGIKNILLGGSGNDEFNVNTVTWFENHFDGGDGTDVIFATANGSRLDLASIKGIEQIDAASFANFKIELFASSSGGATGPTIDLSKTVLNGVASIEGSSKGDTIYLAGAFAGDSATLSRDDTVNATSGDDVVHAGFGNDILNGGAGNDRLFGNDGNDRLQGDAGTDQLNGGMGDDTYIVSDTLDLIVEAAGAGSDTVESSVTFSLASLANVENITLTGTASIDATGNSLRNVLIGNSGDNVLDGGAGGDSLTGGAGADTFVFADGWGESAIWDFNATGPDHDKIDLRGVTAITSYSDLMAEHVVEVITGLLFIESGYGDAIFIPNVSTYELTSDHFIF